MTDLDSRFSTVTGVNGLVAGRYAGRAVALQPTGALIHTLAPPVSTGTLGFAFQLNADEPLCNLTATFAAPSLAANFSVVLDASGHVAVWSGATQIAISTPAFTPYTWAYCGIRATAGPLTGVTVHIDGATVIATNSFNTSPDDTNSIQSFGWQLSSSSAASSVFIDDIYFCDGTGPAPYNGFLGVCRIATVYPTANGRDAQFTTASETNWQAVSDHVMDGDATYTTSGTPGDRDTFLSNAGMTTADVIVAVEPQIAARADDDQTQIQTTLIVAGVVHDGTETSVSTQYGYVSDIYPMNPTTGQPWTSAGFTGLEFGYRNE
jgi:hypothetical protein